MKLSNTSQYAIRILAHLAKREEGAQISASEISETLQIPYKFLTKIMTALVRADLVVSIRGREGGFKLKKSASEIKIDDILKVFRDDTQEDECLLGIGFCDNVTKCALHDQWMKPKKLLQKIFQESSLEDIAHQGSKI